MSSENIGLCKSGADDSGTTLRVVQNKFKSILCPEGFRCSYYKYPLILNDAIDRRKFAELLKRKNGVETGLGFKAQLSF